MRLPEDLPAEVAQRVDPPPFDEVLARARRGRSRRRRGAAAAVLAAAVVVGGVAVGADRLGGSTAGPAAPSTATVTPGRLGVDPGLPPAVQQVLAGDQATVFSLGSSLDGSATAALWRDCPDGDPCRLALVVASGGRLAGAVLDADWLALEPVPGGWVAMDNRGTLFRVGPDTSLSRLDVGRDRVASRPGDAFLTLDGKAMLYRDGELHRARVPAGDVVAGWVTPTGSLVLLRADHGLVLSIGGPERGWVNKRLAVGNAVSGLLAAHDDRAAVVGFGDGADGSLPFAGAWVGGTLMQEVGGWHGVDAPGRLQGHDPSSVAMSDQGTAYVALGDAGTLRIAADGRTTLTRVTDHDVLVTNVGTRVCVLSTAGRGPMRCTGDDGATWTDQPLPGFD